MTQVAISDALQEMQVKLKSSILSANLLDHNLQFMNLGTIHQNENSRRYYIKKIYYTGHQGCLKIFSLRTDLSAQNLKIIDSSDCSIVKDVLIYHAIGVHCEPAFAVMLDS